MSEQILYTVEEVATYLRLSKISVRRLLKEGHLSYINISPEWKRRSLRISKEALEAFIEKGKVWTNQTSTG